MFMVEQGANLISEKLDDPDPGRGPLRVQDGNLGKSGPDAKAGAQAAPSYAYAGHAVSPARVPGDLRPRIHHCQR